MIELKDVSFQYGEGENMENGRIQHINLVIPDGQVILFCGESGCGKTTITRLINGLIPHFFNGELQGSIQIDGKEIKEQPLYETALSVGTVFQNPRSQFFNVDTTSELAFGLENRGFEVALIEEKVHETIREFHMRKLMNRSIFKLSGGEKQKIACGCVSACSPDIYLLDEPSANLDLYSMKQLKKMIIKWKEQGKTIIIAEHRLSYIWDILNRAIYLKNGEIIEDMSSQRLKQMTVEELHMRGLRSNLELTDIVRDDNDTCMKQEIQFKNFIFGYEQNENILNIRNLSVPEHEITAITGNNGIGKSTFLRCICGLESKCKGVMEWQGKLFRRKKRLNEIFLVMQDVNHQLFTESVLEEVLISMKKEDEDKALRILDSLDLLTYKDRHPVSLSGGQKQRVAVATAIASERPILLFDEPTSGLDYKHMLQVAELLKYLKKQGKTILVVTHDVEFIEILHANIVKLNEKSA